MKLKILIKLFVRSFFFETFINLKKMQNLGFAYMVEPFIRFVHKNKKEYEYNVVKNFEYFNTNPFFAMFIVGASGRLIEDGKSNELSKFKSNMVSPLAGLGDAFTWGIMQSFFVFISACMVLFDIYWGPLVFLICYNFMINYIKVSGLIIGYKQGENIISRIVEFNLQTIIAIFKRILLIFVPGVLILWFSREGLSEGKILNLVFWSLFIIILYILSKRLRVIFTYFIFCILSFLYYMWRF